jgi:hypothetical protein
MSYKNLKLYNTNNNICDPYNNMSYILEKFIPINYGNKASVTQNRFNVSTQQKYDFIRQIQRSTNTI